ncbi:dynein heavy chain 2 axonemal-like [Crotalus adamanteus]|uniref:Dynein heavy chain 2 axonemal-like n=1 Tax=Crotalus adamanteus TaxID=8729 RepID=A0AAW1B8T4_CROAD
MLWGGGERQTDRERGEKEREGERERRREREGRRERRKEKERKREREGDKEEGERKREREGEKKKGREREGGREEKKKEKEKERERRGQRGGRKKDEGGREKEREEEERKGGREKKKRREKEGGREREKEGEGERRKKRGEKERKKKEKGRQKETKRGGRKKEREGEKKKGREREGGREEKKKEKERKGEREGDREEGERKTREGERKKGRRKKGREGERKRKGGRKREGERKRKGGGRKKGREGEREKKKGREGRKEEKEKERKRERGRRRQRREKEREGGREKERGRREEEEGKERKKKRKKRKRKGDRERREKEREGGRERRKKEKKERQTDRKGERPPTCLTGGIPCHDPHPGLPPPQTEPLLLECPIRFGSAVVCKGPRFRVAPPPTGRVRGLILGRGGEAAWLGFPPLLFARGGRRQDRKLLRFWVRILSLSTLEEVSEELCKGGVGGRPGPKRSPTTSAIPGSLPPPKHPGLLCPLQKDPSPGLSSSPPHPPCEVGQPKRKGIPSACVAETLALPHSSSGACTPPHSDPHFSLLALPPEETPSKLPEEPEESMEMVVVPSIHMEGEVDLKPCLWSRLSLSGLTEEMWTDEHLAAMDQFLKDVSQTMLVFYVDDFAGLKVEPVMPHQEQKQLSYFIRQEKAEITEENFHEVVQFGSVRKPYIDSLMRMLNAVYLPRLFRKGSWPESIKNEFFSEIYHFMTSLTDTRYKMKGRTVLYIPIESRSISAEVALKDKALVQRLESEKEEKKEGRKRKKERGSEGGRERGKEEGRKRKKGKERERKKEKKREREKEREGVKEGGSEGRRKEGRQEGGRERRREGGKVEKREGGSSFRRTPRLGAVACHFWARGSFVPPCANSIEHRRAAETETPTELCRALVSLRPGGSRLGGGNSVEMASMIHWTRQIKDVLRAQEAVESRESSGPLEEIAFWKNRCTDLSEISKQLCQKGVKDIEGVLTLSKSSYVAPFQRLSRQIQDGSEQAQSNLRFLSILKEPFQELATLRPKDIPEKLPHLISLVRIVWVNSPYYNSRERITALFRKMSNKIIQMCCKDISLDRLFEGYINSTRQTLHSCISCMSSWKDCYQQASYMHNKLSGKGWVLDQTSIFAQVDAFVQRCKDLLEVCDSQQHFARWEDGKQTPLPCFFGQQGPQMARSLLEIEETFSKYLNNLRNVKGGILDVKNTTWHEDFNRFRAGVKDLEVMTQNLMTSAFETVKDVEHGVEIQDIFQHLSSREAIKRTFDKKTVDVFMLFNRELSLVNKELSKKTPFLTPYMCHYSGMAHWMRALRRRVDRPMQCLTKAHFIPHIGTGEESFQTYQLLVQAMDEIERKTFHEWTQGLDKDSLKRLDTPLLIPSAEMPGMLDINFDK